VNQKAPRQSQKGTSHTRKSSAGFPN